MRKPKACPRCGGDLMRNYDSEEFTCLQCGYVEPNEPKKKEIQYA